MTLTIDLVKLKCKLGQGIDTCKYIAMSSDGWECGNLRDSLRDQIDARTNMNAKGGPCQDPKDTTSVAHIPGHCLDSACAICGGGGPSIADV